MMLMLVDACVLNVGVCKTIASALGRGSTLKKATPPRRRAAAHAAHRPVAPRPPAAARRPRGRPRLGLGVQAVEEGAVGKLGGVPLGVEGEGVLEERCLVSFFMLLFSRFDFVVVVFKVGCFEVELLV